MFRESYLGADGLSLFAVFRQFDIFGTPVYMRGQCHQQGGDDQR